MRKFFQVIALVFAVAFGYGLGQHAQDLFATDWPQGGAGGGTHPVNLATDVTGELPHGSTSDDVSQVHGLGSGINVLGNLDASGEFVQRNTIDPGAADAGAGSRFSGGDNTITYGTAFSNAPFVMFAGSIDTEIQGAFIFSVTTTTTKVRVNTVNTASDSDQLRWVALGD